MKKIIISSTLVLSIIAIVVFLFFLSCTKNDTTENLKTTSATGATTNALIEQLYTSVPQCSSNAAVTVIGGNILRFTSVAHYKEVLECLNNQYKTWNNIFYSHFSSKTENELDSLEIVLGYDAYEPLKRFEMVHSTYGNNLRYSHGQIFDSWLQRGGTGNMPVDNIITGFVEQALYNQYYEIAVGDTIYQYRTGNITISLHISLLSQLPTIREMSPSQIEKQYASSIHYNLDDDCHESYLYKDGYQANLETIYLHTKKFAWTYKYETKWPFGARSVQTITNYELKNNKWKKCREVVDIGGHHVIYASVHPGFPAEPCMHFYVENNGVAVPIKCYDMTETEWFEMNLVLDNYLRLDKDESYGIYRYCANNFNKALN